MEKETKRCIPSSNFDRISDLPWNVLDNILVHLPLTTAMRTSILSKSWRYKWVTLSKLDFCFDDIFKYGEDTIASKKKMKNIIYGTLLCHRGQIDKVSLKYFGKQDSYDLDQWLLFLSTKNIKEFKSSYAFDFQNGYKLHSCLFSCQQLDCLELVYCMLELPLTFKGFKNLKRLVLKFVSIRDEEIGSLIQSCPVLEEVNLVSIHGFSSLKIHSPKLKSLNLDCPFDDLSIESCPVLELFSIRWSNNTSAKQPKKPRMVSNLVRALGGLSRLKHLNIWDSFVEYLAVGEVPEKLPTTYNHLKHLALRFLSFNNLKEIQVAFSILRSSPTLKELDFQVYRYNDPGDMEVQAILKFIEAQGHSNISFTQLRLVFISCRGSRAEIEFVKLVLASSPVLETMVIYKCGGISKENIKKELLESERASARAKVKYTSYG